MKIEPIKIEPINLREKLDQVRFKFDSQLAEVLTKQPHLTHAEVMNKFGVSETVTCRVIRRFNISLRKRRRISGISSGDR